MKYSDVKSKYDAVYREADLLNWINLLLNERGYQKVKPQEWRKYRPTWDSPWGYADVRDVANKIKSRRDYRSRVYRLRGSFVPHYFVIIFGKKAQNIRGLMGLERPVPFEELDNVMNRYHKEGGFLTLQYATYKYSGQFPQLWTIKEINFSGTNLSLMSVKRDVEFYSKACGIHPAIAMAYFLCEIPIYYDDFFFLTNNTHKLIPPTITVDIRGPKIPKNAVAMAYSRVQKRMLKKVKHKTRPLSKRVNALLQYMDQPMKSTLTWENKWSLWNKEYPGWRYASVNSMQVTYKRAKDGNKVPEAFKKRLDEVNEQYYSSMRAQRSRQCDRKTKQGRKAGVDQNDR